jgi:hypothetical protein
MRRCGLFGPAGASHCLNGLGLFGLIRTPQAAILGPWQAGKKHWLEGETRSALTSSGFGPKNCGGANTAGAYGVNTMSSDNTLKSSLLKV